MNNLVAAIPQPKNEPVLEYRPGSPETLSIEETLSRMGGETIEIPAIIDGEEVRTGQIAEVRAPHNTSVLLARAHGVGAREVERAIEGSRRAWEEWSRVPYQARAAVFLKAAELLATKYRPILNAATMLGQSKTVHQAEIDAACELIDFFRFNASFMEELYRIQPLSAAGMWNRMEYRPLEGFVFAVTPFNFTSIAANLPAAPALMGNVALWKPAGTSLLSSYYAMKLLEEAGLPPGVIQFLPAAGKSAEIGDAALSSEHLAGVHFTGSTGVFQHMWETVGKNVRKYRAYPRLVGETGGKDFVFVHPSADIAALTACTVRGAYEYQGQKCSAASRMYVPKSLWPSLKDRLLGEIDTIGVGDVSDNRHFMGAVIDQRAYDKIKGYIDEAKRSNDAEVLTSGEPSSEMGYFIPPTLIEAKRPDYRTMQEEIFGPVLTVYAYPDEAFEQTLELCDRTSPYALTGCIWAQDRRAVETATSRLTHAAGNFYVNNKPTGAVVGQQPFGGGRASGTNDKAGSLFNLLRWVSVRTISETFSPPTDYRYPFLGR